MPHIDTSLAKGLASRLIADTKCQNQRAAAKLIDIHNCRKNHVFSKQPAWASYCDQMIKLYQGTSMDTKIYRLSKRPVLAMYYLDSEKNWLTQWEEDALCVRVLHAQCPSLFQRETTPRIMVGKHATARIMERSPVGSMLEMDAEAIFTTARGMVHDELRATIPWTFLIYHIVNFSSQKPIRFLMPGANGAFLVSFGEEEDHLNVRTFIHDSSLSAVQRYAKQSMLDAMPPDVARTLHFLSPDIAWTFAHSGIVHLFSLVAIRFAAVFDAWFSTVEVDDQSATTRRYLRRELISSLKNFTLPHEDIVIIERLGPAGTLEWFGSNGKAAQIRFNSGRTTFIDRIEQIS